MPIHCFEPFPGSPEGHSPRRVFGYFLHAAKSNRKIVPFCLLFAKTKSNIKPSLFLAFREKKSKLFSDFSGKAKDARWFEDPNHRASKFKFFCPLFLKEKGARSQGHSPCHSFMSLCAAFKDSRSQYPDSLQKGINT